MKHIDHPLKPPAHFYRIRPTPPPRNPTYMSVLTLQAAHDLIATLWPHYPEVHQWAIISPDGTTKRIVTRPNDPRHAPGQRRLF